MAVGKNIEGSKELQYGANLAEALGARFGIIHVVEEVLVYPVWGEIVVRTKEEIDLRKRRIEAEVDKYKDRLKSNVKIRIRKGNSPASEILRELHEKNYDLLVLGSRGATMVIEFLVGGVSSQVVRQAKKPVIVVKKTREISSVLMCVDGSKCSCESVLCLAQIAMATNADVTILSVSESNEDDSLKRAREFARKGVEILREHGIRARELVRVGKPSEEVLRESRRQDFDLIAMGSLRKSAVVDILLREAASEVMHNSMRPMLICRDCAHESVLA